MTFQFFDLVTVFLVGCFFGAGCAFWYVSYAFEKEERK